MQINGKNAVVTGGSRGIGRAIALRLAESGVNIAIIARECAEAEEAAKNVRAKGVKAVAINADISKKEQAKKAFEKAFREFGSIDILVNNAGINSRKKFYELGQQEWEEEIATNLGGVFICSKEAAEYMKKNGKGWIVNIASIKGREATSSMAYGASKAGVIGLTKCMAKQLMKDGIRVNAVAPGFVDCGMTKLLSEKELESYLKMIPIGRVAQPAEIANAVAFLCSEESSYIVGATLDVNGGYLMT